MADHARLFRNGGSQAVRLLRDYRYPGDRVRVTKVPGGVLLQPVYADIDEWFAAIDAAGADIPFMEGGREQPAIPSAPSFEAEDTEATTTCVRK